MDRRQFLTGLVSGAAAAVLGIKPDLSPLPEPSYHKYWPALAVGNPQAFYTQDIAAEVPEWIPLETPSLTKIGPFMLDAESCEFRGNWVAGGPLDADEREYLETLAEDCKVSLSIVERPEDMPAGVSVEDAWRDYAKALTEQVKNG